MQTKARQFKDSIRKTRLGPIVMCGMVVLGAAAAATLPVRARSVNDDNVRERLLGSWRLITWEERDASNAVSYPLGPDAIGQISYTNDGRMSAQLMRPPTRRFVNEDWRKATPEERAAAWIDYFGYFGTYSIDLEKKAVIHHIEGSWFPNLVGSDQIRYFRFEGDRLLLDADTEWGKVHIVWQKIKSDGASE